MSKDLKISNVLDKHLSPIEIDGVNVPIEISTETVRFNKDITCGTNLEVQGSLSITGADDNIKLADGIELSGSTLASGYLTIDALAVVLTSSNYGTGDQNVEIQLRPTSDNDAIIKLYNATFHRWSLGNDGSDDVFKINSGASGLSTTSDFMLDSSGNTKQSGSVSLAEKASAEADTAGYGQLWVKNETPTELYFTTDAGDDIQLTDGTSAAGGGGSSTAYWHQMVSGYRNNNTSTSTYYTFYRMWFELWGNADSDPSSIADTDSYSTFFIAPRAGTITNMKVQGWANDTGATDPFRFYFYKGAMSNNSDTMSLTSMVDSGAITPPANGKTFSHTVDFSSSNTFAEDDCLYVWLKKDSNSGNQDLFFNINVNGEYS
mgnify:FL=1